MGLVSKTLSGLAALSNKFWDFGDGDTAPAHVVIDPATGQAVAYPLGQATLAGGSPVSPASDWIPSWVKFEDAPHVSGDAGIPMWAVRNDSGTQLVSANLDYAPLSLDNSSNLKVSFSAGTSSVAITATNASASTGGIALWKRLGASAATTNADFVKASSGRLYKVFGLNASASIRYLKIYNKASAPTVGTDTPILTIALKAADNFSYDFGDIGTYFSAGIAFAITGVVSDADTTAIVSADILGLNFGYA